MKMQQEISELSAEELDGLYKLFVVECARDNTTPTLSDFDIWLVEKGYIN